jgi:molybdenum cofactor biosynthesis protein B
MGAESHRQRAGHRSLGLAVFTLSDTRTAATDESGASLRALAEGAGHRIVLQAILREETDLIRQQLQVAIQRDDVDAVLTTGGTGLSRRDVVYETLTGLLERRLDGFGELFRVLSFQEIGPAAMLSRAVAGTVAGKVIFAMPGSPAAVRLAMTRLILPEINHLLGELQR